MRVSSLKELGPSRAALALIATDAKTVRLTFAIIRRRGACSTIQDSFALSSKTDSVVASAAALMMGIVLVLVVLAVPARAPLQANVSNAVL
jgi:hypothetical protein